MNVYKLFPTTVIEFDLRGYNNKNWLLNYIESSPPKPHALISKGLSSHSSSDILDNPNLIDLKNKIPRLC